MKKKQQEVDSPEEKFASHKRIIRGALNFLQKERVQFTVGLFALVIGLFLAIASVSFFFTGEADQSRVENLSWFELSQVENHILNWGGSWGAYFANLLINEWMGVGAILLSLLLILIALKLMKFKELSIKQYALCTLLVMVWSSLLLGYLFNTNSSFLFLGGKHGFYASRFLQSILGNAGVVLLLVFYTITLFVVFSQRTIPALRNLFVRKQKETKKESVAVETPKAPKVTPQTASEEMPLAPSSPTPSVSPVVSMPESHDAPLVDDPFVVVTNDVEMVEEAPIPPIEIQQKGVEEDEFQVKSVTEETLDRPLELYDPTLDLSQYRHPSFQLLSKYEGNDNPVDMEEQKANKERIISTLENYGIRISSIKATVGPTITLYEIIPEQGIRIAKIRNLGDDIALSLSALGIRIIAPIPGKGTIGIEVPNKDPQIVSMHSVIASRKFQECKHDLPIALGKTITNEIFIEDLCKMPHVLVAGATGQGKSVGLNAIISSLLYKKHPAQLKFVLVDPKKVEFNIYAAIEKHFLATLPDAEEPIVTDVTKVVQTLNSITLEMDNRYDLLKKAQVRNIKEYNAKFIERRLNPNNGHRYMPYIVVIVDEFGDLIMTAGKEVELPIARIAQLARAVGIHMVIATQRPSTNIITGVIKANFPARVAFRVSSMIDSRTILDCPGANQLIGRGDMLFSKGGDLERVQCAFVDTPEVENICNFIGEQVGYPTSYELPEYVGEGGESSLEGVDLNDRDPLFDEAARLIVANQQGSTSLIQRKFSIGYNRAGRLMDQLELAGIVGPTEGSKARQVLVIDDIHLTQILNSLR